jgi:hypothetical protein
MARFRWFFITLMSAVLFFQHAFTFSHTNHASSTLAKRVLISETQCDDSQDAIIANPIFHAPLFANTTIDVSLSDGTNFRDSTA